MNNLFSRFIPMLGFVALLTLTTFAQVSFAGEPNFSGSGSSGSTSGAGGGR